MSEHPHETAFRALMQDLVEHARQSLETDDNGQVAVNLKDVYTRQIQIIAALLNLYSTIQAGSEGMSNKADTTLIALLTTINSLTDNGQLSPAQREAIFDVLRAHQDGDVPDSEHIDNPDARLFALQADLSFVMVEVISANYQELLTEGIHPDDALEVVQQYFTDKLEEFKDGPK